MRRIAIGATVLVMASFCSSVGAGEVQPLVELHFSPGKIWSRSTRRALDAAPSGGYVNAGLFVPSDYRVIDAFARAAAKGKKVRLYLDPREPRVLRLRLNHPLIRLSLMDNVEIRVKSDRSKLMHDKDGSADGAPLRTGGANAGVSGLKVGITAWFSYMEAARRVALIGASKRCGHVPTIVIFVILAGREF